MAKYTTEEFDTLPSLSDTFNYFVAFIDNLPILSDTHILFNSYQDILPAISETLTTIPIYLDTLPTLYDAKVLPPIDSQSILRGFFTNIRFMRPSNVSDAIVFGSNLILKLFSKPVSRFDLFDRVSYILKTLPVDISSSLIGFYNYLDLDYNIESNQFSLFSHTFSQINVNFLIPTFNFVSIVQKLIPTEMLQSDFLNSNYEEFYTTAILTYPLYAQSFVSNFYANLKTLNTFNIKVLFNFPVLTRIMLSLNLKDTSIWYVNSHLNLHTNQNFNLTLNLFDQVKSYLAINFADVMSIFDFVKLYFFKEAVTFLNFYSEVLFFLGNFLVSHLDIADNIRTELMSIIKTILKLSDNIAGGVYIQENLTSIFSFWDFIKEIFKNYGVYIYFNFYNPEKFTFLQTDKLECGDILFLQEDGIYTIDTEDYEDDNNIILDLSQLQIKNVKRIDKIYYSHQPDEIIIIADSNEYYPEIKETFSQIPKGLRAKDYKIVFSGLEEIEYLTLFIYPEFRSKI